MQNKYSQELHMITIQNLTKSYQNNSQSHQVLNNINLSVNTGEYIAVMGHSGSGKSTLLNILGILDNYDEGEYHLNNISIKSLSEIEAAHYRNKLIGFIFQSFNLLPFKTAIDNVSLPLLYQKINRKEREEKAFILLKKLGMESYARHLPTQLSGGQRQRVAIARALINESPLILADEPTGNLDSKTSQDVMEVFTEIHEEGKTILIITHDEKVAAKTQRVIYIQDGQIKDKVNEEIND